MSNKNPYMKPTTAMNCAYWPKDNQTSEMGRKLGIWPMDEKTKRTSILTVNTPF